MKAGRPKAGYGSHLDERWVSRKLRELDEFGMCTEERKPTGLAEPPDMEMRERNQACLLSFWLEQLCSWWSH